MLGITLVGNTSMLNANASRTSAKSSWNVNNQKYNKVLNGKHALFANPSFKHNNFEIYSKSQLTKNYKENHYVTYKILQGIGTNKGTKYYRLVSSINPNVRGWVYSKGLSNINISKNNNSNNLSSDKKHYNKALSYMQKSIKIVNAHIMTEENGKKLMKYKNQSITNLHNVINNVNRIKNYKIQNKAKNIILNDTNQYFAKEPSNEGPVSYAFIYKGNKYSRWECSPLKQIPNNWNKLNKYLYSYNSEINPNPLTK